MNVLVPWDAIISALCYVKNKSRQRDPEMHQTRREINGTLV